MENILTILFYHKLRFSLINEAEIKPFEILLLLD